MDFRRPRACSVHRHVQPPSLHGLHAPRSQRPFVKLPSHRENGVWPEKARDVSHAQMDEAHGEYRTQEACSGHASERPCHYLPSRQREMMTDYPGGACVLLARSRKLCSSRRKGAACHVTK